MQPWVEFPAVHGFAVLGDAMEKGGGGGFTDSDSTLEGTEGADEELQ
jgi:hypothetical protein